MSDVDLRIFTRAALCIEHGLAIVSADSDFARFADLERINPLQ